MTEQTNAALIAEARAAIRSHAPTESEALAYRLADALKAAEKRAEEAEWGLYYVYVALGFDTDGARTPRDLFGPMTRGTPASITVACAKEYRADAEKEAGA